MLEAIFSLEKVEQSILELFKKNNIDIKNLSFKSKFKYDDNLIYLFAENIFSIEQYNENIDYKILKGHAYYDNNIYEVIIIEMYIDNMNGTDTYEYVIMLNDINNNKVTAICMHTKFDFYDKVVNDRTKEIKLLINDENLSKLFNLLYNYKLDAFKEIHHFVDFDALDKFLVNYILKNIMHFYSSNKIVKYNYLEISTINKKDFKIAINLDYKIFEMIILFIL